MLTTKELLLAKCKKLTTRIHRAGNIKQKAQQDLWSNQLLLAEEIYGKKGEEIQYVDQNGVVITAIIDSFQERFWSIIPMCIVSYTVDKTNITTHVSDDYKIINKK